MELLTRLSRKTTPGGNLGSNDNTRRRNENINSAVWGEAPCPPGLEEHTWGSDLDIRLSVYRWRGGGEVVINKHWADVQSRSASMCVYVCVCSLSRCGCQQDHRSGRYGTAATIWAADPMFAWFFFKGTPGKTWCIYSKIPVLSSETSSWTPLLFNRTPALVLPPNLWLEVSPAAAVKV